MLCEHCQEKEATVHLTQVLGEEVHKLHLCEACAKTKGVETATPFSVSDILLGLSPEAHAAPVGPPADAPSTCPRCGLRRSDFKKTGRVGCALCYETFEEDLKRVIKAMHHHERHRGRVPLAMQGDASLREELHRLQEELQAAVAGECFEEAAEIRDQIRSARVKLAAGEAGEETP